MAFLGSAKKEDLKMLVEELGEEVSPEMKVVDLKKLITESENYEEEFVKKQMVVIMEERKERENQKRKEEEREFEERNIKEEREFEERKIKEERELQKKKIKEEREFEERKIKEEWELREKKAKEEREFELEKLKLQFSSIATNDGSGLPSTPKIELRHVMQKFDEKNSDISLYLLLFERQAEWAQIKHEDYVSHLLGLLPSDITQLIAREPIEMVKDYDHIKSLLVKRFKLSPEKFRQKFMTHYKRPDTTWCDFTYEHKNYFEQWIQGLKITTFENLSGLIITEQIRRKVPMDIKEHFLDVWSQFMNPNETASKLDDYENVRSNSVRKKKKLYQENGSFKHQTYDERGEKHFSERKYVPPPQQEFRNKNFHKNETANSRKVTRDCYICGLLHFARDCPNRYKKSQPKESSVEKKQEDILTAEIQSELINDEKNLNINTLQYVDICVDNKELKTLIDSGAMIPVLNLKYVSSEQKEKGKIILKSAFRERIDAILSSFQISLKNKNNEAFSRPIEIVAAITDRIQEQFIIPPPLY